MIRRRRDAASQRLLCFDMENRPLAYWYQGETTSEITAFGWKWAHESGVQTMLLRNDGRFDSLSEYGIPGDIAYERFRDILETADTIVYGHNIRKHDLPMFNAGLLRRQLRPLGTLTTTDTLRDIPKRGGMSASLENLATMYGLRGEKYGMSQHMWEQANRLTDDGLGLARKRVEADVLLQEQLRNKLDELKILKPAKTWNP